MIKTAGEVLGITGKDCDIVSVIGCGGKTSLVNSLAFEYKNSKVLISPTTKIKSMINSEIMLIDTLENAENHKAHKGLQCIGLDTNKMGKLSSLPLKMLENMVSDYNVSLLEADGSRRLPCKGWLETEPVIIDRTTHTVGVLTFDGLNKPVSEETVLRIDEFSKLTGLLKGDIIDEKALENMLFNDGGMFKNAVGRCAVFLNKIHNENDRKKAIKFLSLLKENCKNKCQIFAFGSAKENRWETI